MTDASEASALTMCETYSGCGHAPKSDNSQILTDRNRQSPARDPAAASLSAYQHHAAKTYSTSGLNTDEDAHHEA
jgi:hypothetical protein